MPDGSGPPPQSSDACLMPFPLNAATPSIRPTKALEYMTVRKPIVSTAVPDVVAGWPGAVRIADGNMGFAAAVEAAMAEPPASRAEREHLQAASVAGNGWDRAAEEMGALVDATLGA